MSHAGRLLTRLSQLEQRVRDAVAARQATDPAPGDPYRGLYLTPDVVQRVLDAPLGAWTTAPRASTTVDEPAAARGHRLAGLATAFGLTPLDVEFLLVAVAPDVDPRFERLYGYLNDDVTRRRATPGLALELCGVPPAGGGRFRFAATAPLIAGGLVELLEPERPALSRTLRVPDRVVAHLLGDDEADARLAGLATLVPPAPAGPLGPSGRGPLADRLAAGIDAGVDLLYLHDGGAGAEHVALGALAAAGRDALVLDPPALADHDDPRAAIAVLVREARLRGAGIVLGPPDALAAAPGRPERRRLLRDLTSLAPAVPLLVHGPHAWDPAWSARTPVPVPVPPPGPADRAEQWRRALAGHAGPIPDTAWAPYRLGPDQVRRAAAVATQLALLGGRPVTADDLRAGVRTQNGAGLGRLARRIAPAVGWPDLVLPRPTLNQLAELVRRARHRDRVLGQWRMRPGGGRGRGVIALFAGESGTGKTMSAEVVAADLGMDLYVVDLSGVVDKYIGETEKNLERVFAEAAGVNGVLLFDEADALFGKRSQVKDARDRYANVESAFLLQRMESFDGIAVLTTNLRANLDDAFTRRLDVIADFPMPDAAQRLALWDRCLGTALPRGDDLDLPFCAERFELAGGSIRACAVTAAYLAADAGGPVGMPEIMAAVHQEYRKLGRLLLPGEFGHWLTTLSAGRPA